MSFLFLALSGAAVLILLAASAFCSASEASVLATSRVRLHHLAQKGNTRAQTILGLQNNMGSFISTILLANTWCITIVTALATGVLTSMFGGVGAIYAGFAMTALITIYGEVSPKIYVYSNPDKTALAFAPLFPPLVWLMSPLTRLIDWIARGTLRLFGVRLNTETQTHSPTEELRGAIDLHQGVDSTKAGYERSMLNSILDLTHLEVEEIMTHRKEMFVLNMALPPKDLIDQVLASPYTRIPLWQKEPDNIVGMLHAKDLLRALQKAGNHAENLDLASLVMPAWFIPESTTLFAQLQAFREKREHFALVVDEYGALQGLVTLEDILEEIVGEIVDEHDVELSGVRMLQSGAYVVDGTVTIRDLNRQFDWELPDKGASTIAGLVLHEARTIPKVGQSFLFYGFQFDIVRRHRQQITQIRVRRAGV